MPHKNLCLLSLTYLTYLMNSSYDLFGGVRKPAHTELAIVSPPFGLSSIPSQSQSQPSSSFGVNVGGKRESKLSLSKSKKRKRERAEKAAASSLSSPPSVSSNSACTPIQERSLRPKRHHQSPLDYWKSDLKTPDEPELSPLSTSSSSSSVSVSTPRSSERQYINTLIDEGFRGRFAQNKLSPNMLRSYVANMITDQSTLDRGGNNNGKSKSKPFNVNDEMELESTSKNLLLSNSNSNSNSNGNSHSHSNSHSNSNKNKKNNNPTPHNKNNNKNKKPLKQKLRTNYSDEEADDDLFVTQVTKAVDLSAQLTALDTELEFTRNQLKKERESRQIVTRDMESLIEEEIAQRMDKKVEERMDKKVEERVLAVLEAMEEEGMATTNNNTNPTNPSPIPNANANANAIPTDKECTAHKAKVCRIDPGTRKTIVEKKKLVYRIPHNTDDPKPTERLLYSDESPLTSPTIHNPVMIQEVS